VNQTTLTDQDRAILARLKLPACRNESRGDDTTDFLTMLARDRSTPVEPIGGLALSPSPLTAIHRREGEIVSDLLIEFLLENGIHRIVCCGRYRNWHHFNKSRADDACRGWICKWAKSVQP